MAKGRESVIICYLEARGIYMKLSYFILLSLLFSFQFSFADKWAPDGGMSGGGGVVLPVAKLVNILDTETAEAYVKSSRQIANSYLSDKYIELKNAHGNSHQKHILGKLFSVKIDDILATTKKYKVIILDDEACVAPPNKAVDGSFEVIKKFSYICISTFSITPKVDASEFKQQVAALLIHEYTELLGHDESYAVQVQEHVLGELLKRK